MLLIFYQFKKVGYSRIGVFLAPDNAGGGIAQGNFVYKPYIGIARNA